MNLLCLAIGNTLKKQNCETPDERAPVTPPPLWEPSPPSIFENPEQGRDGSPRTFKNHSQDFSFPLAPATPENLE